VVGSPRLLVLRALGLGDLLTAVPALRGLARAFPEHIRVLAAPRALAPLLKLIRLADGTHAVDELLDLSLLAPTALAHASIGHGGLAGAVNLHGRGPESHMLLLAAHPGWLMAFANEQVPESRAGPAWREGEHEVERWCRMLREHGVPCDPGELDLQAPKVPLPPNAIGATVIHPGASSGSRRWPLRRWAAVAAAERIVGRRVLLTGTAAERPLATAIAESAGLPREAVIAGRTTIDELAGVVAAAGRVVCGDTGVGHLATALGTPSVLLFGPVSPAQWGPPRCAAERHRVLWAGESGDPHGQSPDPGLLRITVARVLDALEALAV
jgi:ADP-heptose:LPS heptosyltransferase